MRISPALTAISKGVLPLLLAMFGFAPVAIRARIIAKSLSFCAAMCKAVYPSWLWAFTSAPAFIRRERLGYFHSEWLPVTAFCRYRLFRQGYYKPYWIAAFFQTRNNRIVSFRISSFIQSLFSCAKGAPTKVATTVN